MASATATEPQWLGELRDKAKQRAAELPKPVLKDRGWEFTDLSGFDPDSYEQTGCEVDFDTGDLPDGVVASELSDAAEQHSSLVEQHLGSLLIDRDLFTAQNTAGWERGVFVYVPAGVELQHPIEIAVNQLDSGSTVRWRSLIVLERGAKATVREHYRSASNDLDAYFNPVTELIVADEAQLEYLCEQNISEQSWILGSQRAQVGKDASLHWIGLGLGSGNGKLRMETDLRGRGSSGKVTGAYATHQRQRLDYETTQEHFAADTTSDLAFRGVLRDRSNAVWSGMIKVDPGAQRTDAFQENRNLLLNDGAHADAIPGLEIEANDVRCTHAATISRIDDAELFYLQSRGLSRADAERLLIGGFLEVVAARLEDSEHLQEYVSGALERELEELLA